MFQKRIDFHNINDNKSFSIYNDKTNSNYSIRKIKYNKNLLSPSKPLMVESKSQTTIFSLKKQIKISFNKYHQYIKSIQGDKNKDINKRPLSLYFNQNKNKNTSINNNRVEIESNYSFMTKHKNYSNNSNSLTNRTMLLNFNGYNTNSNQKKLNKLNIGINSQSTKNSSFMHNYINNKDNSLFNQIQNSNSTMSKNIASLTLKKLKNSKFFYKTKYVSGIKNKNNKNITKNSSLSTYNISFNPEEKNDILYKAINTIIKNKILTKMKLEESEESNVNNYKKPTKEKMINNIEKAKYFDFLPVILNHMKQKQTMDDIYGEYNLYLSNISKSTVNNSVNKKNLEKNKYPKIKYLFLENVINNLKHMVKFVNIKNNEELEQNVINIIRDEYSKLKQENKEMENIQDFLTYGYEYIPKRDLINQLPFLEERGLQTYEVNNNKNNKQSIFFVNEQKIEENQPSGRDSNERIYSMKNIYINKDLNRKRSFGKMEIKSRNKEQREEFNSIFSSFSINDTKKIMEEKKSINSLLQNEQLKTIDILKNKLNKIKEKTKRKNKPKFIKINLKGNKINEDIKDNSSIKFDTSDKINETLFPSSLEQKESKEKNESNKESLNEKIIDKEDLETNKENNNNKNENINEINNLQLNNNINNISPEENKENNTSNINKENNNKKEEINKKNIINNNINNNKPNEINIINKNINKENKDDKNKEEEINKEDNDNSASDISEKKEESLTKEEEKENKEEKKDIIEDLIKEQNEEIKESSKNIRKTKKIPSKKKKTNNFLKSIENTLIALSQIRKHAKRNTKKKKPMYNELFYNHRNEKTNSDNEEQSQSDSISLNKEDNPKQLDQKKELEEKDFDSKEITVSSLSDSSVNELNEFVKLKKVILSKTKKQAFDEEKRKLQYKRRDALINPSIEAFKEAAKSQQMVELNNKMKKLYDNIHKEKKREENKTKKKKYYMFSFDDVDINNIDDIEKRKKVNLNRLKEDIKYKIITGKFPALEMQNFQVFSMAVMDINFFKFFNNKKKLKEYMHSMEKYFQLFYNELINRERQYNEEKRINKFLYNLKQEVGETIPYVTICKGKFCRSIDLNKEGDLSILNSP